MKFDAPIDEFSIPGRGIVRVVKLAHGSSQTAIKALIGKVVDVGERKMLVRGVETYAVMNLNAGTPIGLMGDWQE